MTDRPTPRAAAARALGLAAWAVAFLLVVAFFSSRQGGDLSVQAELNLRFVGRPLLKALDHYPRLRPPFYPLVLWAADRAGVPPSLVHQIVQLGVVLGVLALCRRTLQGVHALYPSAAYAVAHFNYVNLHQYTAEALCVPLTLALAVLLAAHLRSGGDASLLGLAAVVSLLCLSRYFDVVFALPAALAGTLLLAPGSPPRRLLRAAAVAAIGGLPVAGWMLLTRLQTGYWTGDDRLAPRHFPPDVEYWSGLTSFGGNLLLTGRTLLVDFFSPTLYAAHAVVTLPHELSPVEWLALLLLAASAAVAGRRLALVCRAHRDAGTDPPPFWKEQPPFWAAPGWVLAELAALYLAVTIALWTVGNNDPIYTRFLYPCYVLLVLAGSHAYAWVKARAASAWELLPFRLLYLVFVGVQLHRDFRAGALPVRFFT